MGMKYQNLVTLHFLWGLGVANTILNEGVNIN